MTHSIRDLGKPSEFWEYFEEISKIPRCSGAEKLIRKYIINEAEKFGFKSKVDKVKNLLVEIPSKNENDDVKKVILQCHMDMVCVKNEDIEHDFTKDPLKLKIIKIINEKWLTAEGTTLGADNGGGIAYLLTLMKKIYNKELDFSQLILNLLFTVNEERGLSGVFRIDDDFIDGDYLINLDSEEDDTFTIGCAGGIQTHADIKYKNQNINEHINNITAVKVNVKGLLGGHSGVDINKNRANSIKILVKILSKLNDNFSIYMNSINGGNLSNVIPREANSIFYVESTYFSDVRDFTHQIISEIKEEYSENEPEMNITITPLKESTDKKILPIIVQVRLLYILDKMPNGPISLHPKFSNLVHTSTNLAAIKTRVDLIKIITSQRSVEEKSKKEISERIESYLRSAEFDIDVVHPVDYPGWEPNFNSKLLSISKSVYKELFHGDPIIEMIHAGLETGILKKKFPNLEMISIGPTLKNPHSPDERLKIGSVEKFWIFLIKLIEKLSKV